MNKIEDTRQPEWPKGLYLRGESYRFSRTVNGKRTFEVFGPVSLEEATKRATRYNFDIEDGKEPATRKAQHISSFKQFAYDVWLQEKSDLEASSYSRYRAVIDNFSYYLAEVRRMRNPALKAISPGIAAEYIVHRKTEPLMPNGSRKFTRKIKAGASKATLHFEKDTLKQIFRFAIKKKLVEFNPFEDVKAARPNRKEMAAKHRPLSKLEESALLKAAASVESGSEAGNAKFVDIVEFLLKTGERLNEMVNLEWTDVNWEDGVISVDEKQVTEKRTVSIPPKAIKQVKDLIAKKEPEDRMFATEKSLNDFGVCLDIREKDALMNIKVGEVDLEKAVIATSRTFTWHPKGSEGEIPMCDSVRGLLERLKTSNKSNFVFAHHDGGRCRLDVLDLLKKAQKLAEIKGRLRVHDLRHTCAVRLRENGVPLETIMGILRHSDLKETLIYAPYRRSEGQKAIRCLDVLDKVA